MATKKEAKPSKKPQQAEDRDEADEAREDEDEDDAGSSRPAAAEERRARMRARRAAPAAAEEDHGHDDDDHDHGKGHGHDHGHDHDDEEDEIDTSNDPTWWVPHLVLGALVLIGVFGFFGSFNSLAERLGYKGMPGLAAAGNTHKPAEHSSEPTPPPPRPTPMQDQAPKEMFGAKHLLVMYKGSMRAPESITRTKEEAKVRAEEALKKAKDGAKFEDLVKDYSDEPGAAQRGGDLGQFPKGRMVPQFQEGLEKTKVGGVSDIVETPFGYHVILRTK